MARTTKKVGTGTKAGQSAEQAEKPKQRKQRKKKAQYPIQGAMDAKGNPAHDENGKLTAVPATPEFNAREHKPMTKKNFADEATFFDFKAHLADQNAEKAKELAESYRKKAKTLRQFGDEKTRKKASKLQKMQEMAQKLQAELESEGIDVAELLEED